MLALRSSASSFWFNCQAQPLFASRLPEQKDTDATREGTCAAWLGEMVLTGCAPNTKAMLGHSHENGWLIDADMVEFVQDYCDKVRSLGGVVGAEKFVRLSGLIAGTPDSYVVISPAGVLFVIDLKYGHKLVEVDHNTQVSIYGGALYRLLTLQGVKITKVVLAVYQPRAFSANVGTYRTWEPELSEFLDFVSEIENRGELCQEPNPVATAGPHCDHCVAAAGCQALTSTVVNLIENVESQDHRQMTGRELSHQLDFANHASAMVEIYAKSLMAEGEARHAQGEHIKGYGHSQRSGKRKLTMLPENIKMLTGVDATKGDACTPAQLEKRGVAKDVVAAMSTTPDLSPKFGKLDPNHFSKIFNN